MKNKISILIMSGVIALSLVGCSTKTKDIVSMKGATITVEDFYNEVKKNPASQRQVSSMIIYKVFEDAYGKNVSEKEVEKEVKEQKKAIEEQGGTLEQALAQQGMDEIDLKKMTRKQLAFQSGIQSQIKITDKDLKKAWQTFYPEVEAQLIAVETEEEAKEIKKSLVEGGDFTKLAKEKSTDTSLKEGKKITFNSEDIELPMEVKKAAFKLKDGEISDPIADTNPNTYQPMYYLIKMSSNKGKGNDMKPYEKELKEIAKENQQNDPEFISKTIRKELKKAKVTIVDKDFKEVLDPYLKEETSDSENSKDTKQESSTTDKEK